MHIFFYSVLLPSPHWAQNIFLNTLLSNTHTYNRQDYMSAHFNLYATDNEKEEKRFYIER
jgi:hypothetical protein